MNKYLKVTFEMSKAPLKNFYQGLLKFIAGCIVAIIGFYGSTFIFGISAGQILPDWVLEFEFFGNPKSSWIHLESLWFYDIMIRGTVIFIVVIFIAMLILPIISLKDFLKKVKIEANKIEK